jgi:LacI family transcriptional regulator
MSRPAQRRAAAVRHRTLTDVASAADVSPSTASRALRDSPLVREATRRRVHAAARRLGYEPNRLARSLRTRSSSLIGVVVPDLGVGFYARSVKGAQDIFERGGYQVLVMNTEREPAREAAALRTLLAHRVDGMLVATSGGFITPPGIPVVFFDNLVDGAGVARANREGMALLVDHLLEHGRRRIAYVGAPPLLTSGIERLDGFRLAVARQDLDVPAEYVQLGDEVWSPESGADATRALLALEAPPTALVTASDTLALGAMKAIRLAGMRVPEDVAIVSFDDPFFGDLLDPPMTALARAERELGEFAASLLLHTLESGPDGPVPEVRLPVRLIVRRSCGCG